MTLSINRKAGRNASSPVSILELGLRTVKPAFPDLRSCMHRKPQTTWDAVAFDSRLPLIGAVAEFHQASLISCALGL